MDTPASQWRALSPAEREREYSPSSCVGGDISEYLAAYRQRSERARELVSQAGRIPIEVRYGPARSQTVDLVTPERNAGHAPAPLLVFIHGGYWQQLSKLDSFFAGHHALMHDVGFAAIDYTLAPHASLDEIVSECRAAMLALLNIADEHHIDRDRIVVAGSSAGAHLAAMVGFGVETPSGETWRPAAVGLVSGIFELEPLIGTSINDAVGLDQDSALRNSPMFGDLVNFPRALIAFGDNETNEFKQQSTRFTSLLIAADRQATLVEIAPRNHFDVILDLCDDQTELGRKMLDLLERRVR